MNKTVKIHQFKQPSWAMHAALLGNSLALVVVDKLMVQKCRGQFSKS